MLVPLYASYIRSKSISAKLFNIFKKVTIVIPPKNLNAILEEFTITRI